MRDQAALSDESLTELLRRTVALGASQPWKTLDNIDVFIVTIPGTEQFWAVMVLGAGSQEFGIHFYEGFEGVAFVGDLADGLIDETDIRERFEALNGLGIDYEMVGHLEAHDRKLLEKSGLLPRSGPARKKGRWPALRRYEAGFVPDMLTTEKEVETFGALVTAFSHAFAAIRQDPSLIERDPDGDWDLISGADGKEPDPELLAKFDRYDFPDFPIWRCSADGTGGEFERINLSEPVYELPMMEVSPEASRALFRLRAEATTSEQRVVWEIGCLPLGPVASETQPGRGEFSEAWLIVEAVSGLVLGVQIGAVRDRLATLGRLVSQVLIDSKRLPVAFFTAEDDDYDLLSRFCEDQGIDLEVTDTPALDEALESLSEQFGGR
jgi:hypothetical protein